MPQSEHQIQAAAITLVSYMLKQFPELELLHAIPNGEKRDKKTGAKLKAQGVKPGMLDLHLPVARGEYHSLYIEVKTPKGALTKAQRVMIPKLQQQGNAVYVCRSTKDIIQTLRDYLEG